ncbi:MAG TPA: tyrosinase family protein [Candidatus Rubrimentiphilum sp.]|nr:tyrosinase family protein [Candidatus Rubrimentiphilum sp.]
MTTSPTRRRFIGAAGAIASTTLIGSSLLNAGIAEGAGPFVRRDIGGLMATDPIIVSYRKAVKAMQTLSMNNPNDPRGWAYQAAIHGTRTMPTKLAWNTCQHGTLFFWSWHRMYLYWFERIVRKMSSDPTWALPYWNWTSASERHLPSMFRDVTSELYTPNRNPSFNDGTGSLPATDVDYSAAFAFAGFADANGFIQGTPHGDVHVDIGGWMGDVPTAAQDPIFYLHHSNIDRLWNLWLAQGGGRTDPLADNPWKNTIWTFFDENGATVHMTSCDVLRAALQLNYRYEGEPAQVNEYCRLFFKPPIPLYYRVPFLHIPVPPETLGQERVSFPLFNTAPLREKLFGLAESQTRTLMLDFSNVVAQRQPGVVWEVYVGLPANAAANPKGPFYVGNLSLFGTGIRSDTHGNREFQPARFSYAINKAVAASLRLNEERVTATLVPHGILINGKPSTPKVLSPVRIGQVNILVEQRR